MSDLLTRLKQQMFDDDSDGNLVQASIDRIEALESELNEMCKVYGQIAFDVSNGGVTSDRWIAADCVLSSARNTLKAK